MSARTRPVANSSTPIGLGTAVQPPLDKSAASDLAVQPPIDKRAASDLSVRMALQAASYLELKGGHVCEEIGVSQDVELIGPPLREGEVAIVMLEV